MKLVSLVGGSVAATGSCSGWTKRRQSEAHPECRFASEEQLTEGSWGAWWEDGPQEDLKWERMKKQRGLLVIGKRRESGMGGVGFNELQWVNLKKK